MKKPQTISSSVPNRISQGLPPEAPRSLLACFLDIVADWEALFPSPVPISAPCVKRWEP